MCGICGQFNYKTLKPVSQEKIERMTSSMAHRGPDDEGYYLSGPIGLGFRRLSIIDLKSGHQPMSDDTGKIWVVFNGEIYNFPELRRELEGSGYRFQTRSDTEVLIHGYLKWDLGLFEKLNGMFGVGIWDDAKQRLILARDPMGIKLVYYRLSADGITFGSEIRSIQVAESAKFELDAIALNLFLRFRYTPSPLTIHKDVRKLAPGTMLIAENGKKRVERWYKQRPILFKSQPNPDNAARELLEIYQQSVKRHLLSDVPLGLLLSGGIDSGLLLSLMNLYGQNWKTFSIGYGSSYRDDELFDAGETAKYYRSDHTSIEINQDTFEKHLPEIVGFLEEPIASSSIVPMYFVCLRAREDVKVVLMGQGPDELFGGYLRHLGVRYGAYWRNLPDFVTSAIMGMVRVLPRNETLKRGVESLGTKNSMQRYREVFSIIPGHLVNSLFLDGILPDDMDDQILHCWEELGNLMGGSDELGNFQLLELRSSLPDELLLYADKMSMAHGLEVRVPYLDREVVEYVQQLSQKFKVRNGQRKWLHRKVCKANLPREFINRKKRGFAVKVVDDWLQKSMQSKMHQYLLDDLSLIYRYLNQESVKELLSHHITGRNDYHKILFSLVLLEEWFRNGKGQMH